MAVEKIQLKAWLQIAEDLFGTDPDEWRFKCTSCGHAQSTKEVLARHPSLNREDVKSWIYFSCEGRQWACYGKKPQLGCDWTLGGLFQIHKVEVVTPEGKEIQAFEFAHSEGMTKIIAACTSCEQAVCPNPEHPGYVQ
jgi:hypothetical protein